MSDPARLRVRPLLVRPGARFTCFVGGGCCSDIHHLGPLSRGDIRRLRLVGAGDSVRTAPNGQPELRCTSEGRCGLLVGSRCSLHTEHGAAAKPGPCRRFPFALVATPLGGRVSTAHRCPCRSLGERLLITPADAEASLVGPGGKLIRNEDGPLRVLLKPRTSVSFASYVGLEGPLLARLAEGDPPSSVLAVEPGLPRLRAGSWREIADQFAAFGGHPSRGGQALAWFGDGLLMALGEVPGPRSRPWTDDFDRAEARTLAREPPARIIGDWLADLVWGLSWAPHGPLDRARASLGALAEVASAVTARLLELGARGDRAAAEAILVTESGAFHPIWASIMARMEPASGWMTSRDDP